jgi:hypothetical protein
MRARGFVVVAAASLLVLGTACELLVAHDLTAEPQDSFDAAEDTAPLEAGMEAGDGAPRCPYSTEPDLTTNGDDGNSGMGNAAVLVLRSVSFDTPSGVDLDGVCTCQFNGTLSSCDLPQNAPTGGACDADGGVDDRAADLFTQFPGGLAKRFTDQANHFTGCGQQAILIGITDYNGLANDSKVKINSIASAGILDVPAQGADGGVDPGNCGGANDGGTTHYLPRWDGTDRWAVRPDGMIAGVPSTLPINGFVRNYELVADSRAVGQLDAPLVINLFGTGNVRLNTPVILGRIRPSFGDGGIVPLDEAGAPTTPPSSFVLEGSISGRANADDLLAAAALARYDTGGTVLCTVPIYDAIKPEICGYRDISFDPSLDFVKGHTCDGLSLTFQFTAFPARIGNEHPSEDAGANPCRPDQLSCGEAAADASSP